MSNFPLEVMIGAQGNVGGKRTPKHGCMIDPHAPEEDGGVYLFGGLAFLNVGAGLFLGMLPAN